MDEIGKSKRHLLEFNKCRVLQNLAFFLYFFWNFIPMDQFPDVAHAPMHSWLQRELGRMIHQCWDYYNDCRQCHIYRGVSGLGRLVLPLKQYQLHDVLQLVTHKPDLVWRWRLLSSLLWAILLRQLSGKNGWWCYFPRNLLVVFPPTMPRLLPLLLLCGIQMEPWSS